MSVFSEKELDYLAGRRLGRLATIGGDGVPHVVPLGWSYNPALDTIDVGGRDFARTKKFRNARANPKVALVIDDVLPPWRPRCVMVRGEAEALDEAASADGEQLGPGRQRLRRPRICMSKEARTMTVRITGIAGSLRRESFNRKLLHAAAHEMPHGAELTVWDGLGAVPPFSEDLEAAPAPAGVTDLRQVIAEADGLLFATR